MKHHVFAVFLMLLLPSLAWSDSYRTQAPFSKEYRDERGSCHLAYPPGLLGAEDWRKLMSALDRHFGSDASLDAKTRSLVAAYLEKNAGGRGASQSSSRSRITETAWFRREHREVNSQVWKDARVKSAANCQACHTGAEQGRFGEHEIRIPGRGRHHEHHEDEDD